MEILAQEATTIQRHIKSKSSSISTWGTKEQAFTDQFAREFHTFLLWISENLYILRIIIHLTNIILGSCKLVGCCSWSAAYHKWWCLKEMYTIFSRPNSKFSFSNCWRETEGLKSQHQYPQLTNTQIDNFHNIIQGFVLCLYNLQEFFATMVHPLQPPSLFLKVGISLMKEGCLFVCFVCHGEISQTTMPLAAFLVHFESPKWVWVHKWIWVHRVGFIMFQSKVEKLLNIE